MTLSYSTEINGKPTYFVEKIWQGLHLGLDGYQIEHRERVRWTFKCIRKGVFNPNIISKAAKIHTIREDKSDRWKAGNKIHMVINNRTPDRFQFAPVIECISTQRVEIKHHVGHIEIHIDGECFYEVFHHGLDEIYEYTTELESFVKNDGFDSIEDFFKWFDKDYTGKIIHWTDHRY